MKVVVIRTDGTCYIERLTRPLHRSAGQIVEGAIEIVYRPARLKQPYCMIVNEEFLLQGLPINPIGSFLYGTDRHGHPICGNIIISKIKEDDLEGLTDKEAGDIARIMGHLSVKLKED